MLLLKGNYTKALEYVRHLRTRAAHKTGEVRPNANHRSEGGTRSDVTTPPTAPTASFTTNDPRELYPPTVSSTADRSSHFILNERARELFGGLHRWEDLARTETLLTRAPCFSPDAAGTGMVGTGIKPFHKLRPIPQTHLERIFRNGQPLGPAARAAEQSPGCQIYSRVAAEQRPGLARLFPVWIGEGRALCDGPAFAWMAR